MSEINVFTIDPNGYKTHWKISETTTGDDLNALTQRQAQLSKFLHEHSYISDPMSGGDVKKPLPWAGKNQEREEEDEPRRNNRQRGGRSAAPKCDVCGGPCYDNRGNKPGPKSPDFKCKDKRNCGAAGWERDDGTVRWVEE